MDLHLYANFPCYSALSNTNFEYILLNLISVGFTIFLMTFISCIPNKNNM